MVQRFKYFRLLLLVLLFVGCADTSSSEPDLYEPEDGVDHGEWLLPEGVESRGLPIFNIRVGDRAFAELNGNEDPSLELEVKLEVEGEIYEGVTLELHGGYSRSLPKKSYRMTFDDDDELMSDIFTPGLVDDYRRLVFHAAWIDPTFSRNALTHDAHRAIGGLSPRVSYAELYFNGQYHGLYSVIERIDKQFLKRRDLDRDCNLYKAVSHSANWGDKEDNSKGYEIKLEDKDPWEDLDEMIKTLHEVEPNHSAFVEEVEPILHLDDFMSWQIAHTYATDQDCFTKNYYLHHDTDTEEGSEEDIFRVISWDADATWGISWDGTEVEADASRWHGNDRFSPVLFKIPEYKTRYLDWYHDALEEELDEDVLIANIEARSARIRDAAIYDLGIWQPEIDFDQEVERLNEIIVERHNVMEDEIDSLRQD